MGFGIGNITNPFSGGINPIAAASAFGGYLSYKGQSEANAANREIAAAQTAFQERMSNTAAQRAVKDYMRAGLNPMLVARMGGASTPQGQSAVMQNPYSHAPDNAVRLATAQQAQAQARKTNAEARVIETHGLEQAENNIIKTASEIGVNRQKAMDLYASVEQRSADVFRIEDDRARIRALAQNIKQSTNFIEQQTRTEVQRERVELEKVDKTRAETLKVKADKLVAETLAKLYLTQAAKEDVSMQMLLFDLDALQKLEGMQKYVPIIQQIRAIIK